MRFTNIIRILYKFENSRTFSVTIDYCISTGFLRLRKADGIRGIDILKRISSVTGLHKKGVAHAIIWLVCAHVLCVCVNGIQIKAHFVTRALNNG